ncbi:MAG: DUF4286 family protein [Muribaculum sp.]|nr:DUF4286 family protein [Muribaculum sp.]
MIINTTFAIDRPITEQWLTWMRMAYIPEATGMGNLSSPVLTRIITDHTAGEGDADSYALQLRAESATDVDRWLSTLQPDLLNRMAGRWGSKALYFNTLMEEVAI